MKRLTVVVLLVLLSCVSVFAAPENSRYKVKLKVSDRSVKAKVGDSLELTLKSDLITVVDKNCGEVPGIGSGQMECSHGDVIAVQFLPSAITDVVAGQGASFVSIIWSVDGMKAMLIVEPNQKDFPLIVGRLEEMSGKKAVNADTQPSNRPRVFLRSESFGNQWNAVRNQSMEMSKDFGNACPIVQITINDQKADFTLGLNHIERGLVIRDNQIEVYNKDGDLISGKEGGSIMGGVKGACALIITSWGAQRQ